jgi:hypothetical protein
MNIQMMNILTLGNINSQNCLNCGWLDNKIEVLIKVTAFLLIISFGYLTSFIEFNGSINFLFNLVRSLATSNIIRGIKRNRRLGVIAWTNASIFAVVAESRSRYYLAAV